MALVVEYLVVPQLMSAGRNLDLLRHIDLGWVLAGAALEAASLLSYTLLLRTMLPTSPPGLGRLARIVLSTTGLSHVIPAGSAGSAGLGYRLLTSEGVDGPAAAFALGSSAILSAIVLNVTLWTALIVSIPLAGVHPIYVVIALCGILLLLAVLGVLYLFTRAEERAVRIVRVLGAHIPRVGADRLEALVRELGESVAGLKDHTRLRRATSWAALNWIFDAAALWSFLAAFGTPVDPIILFAAYGIANVLGALPIVPGGLGVVEASAASLLVTFGVAHVVATLGVLGWRLVNFWLPIPVGAAAYLSLRVQHHRAERQHEGGRPERSARGPDARLGDRVPSPLDRRAGLVRAPDDERERRDDEQLPRGR